MFKYATSLRKFFKGLAANSGLFSTPFSERDLDKTVDWWTQGFRQAVDGLKQKEIKDFSSRLRKSLEMAIRNGDCISPCKGEALPTFIIVRMGKGENECLKISTVLYFDDSRNEHWKKTDATFAFIHSITLLYKSGNLTIYRPSADYNNPLERFSP